MTNRQLKILHTAYELLGADGYAHTADGDLGLVEVANLLIKELDLVFPICIEEDEAWTLLD